MNFYDYQLIIYFKVHVKNVGSDCKIFTKSSLVQGVRWNPSSKSKLDKSL